MVRGPDRLRKDKERQVSRALTRYCVTSTKVRKRFNLGTECNLSQLSLTDLAITSAQHLRSFSKVCTSSKAPPPWIR
jgi:hypothetical protein